MTNKNQNETNSGCLAPLISILIIIVFTYLACGCANLIWLTGSKIIVGEPHTIPICDFIMRLIEKIFQ